MAHIAHVHTLAGEQRTGLDILDPNDPKRHWHEVDGDRTTSDPFGQGHIHLFRGRGFLAPVLVSNIDFVGD